MSVYVCMYGDACQRVWVYACGLRACTFCVCSYERFLNAAETYLRKYGNVKVIRHWVKKSVLLERARKSHANASLLFFLKKDGEQDEEEAAEEDEEEQQQQQSGDLQKEEGQKKGSPVYFAGLMKRVNEIAEIKRKNNIAALSRGQKGKEAAGDQNKPPLLTHEEKRALDQEEEKWRKELREAGYVEFLEVIKPWRLHARGTSSEKGEEEEEERDGREEGGPWSASKTEKKKSPTNKDVTEEEEDAQGDRRDYWLEALQAELPSWVSERES